MLLLYAADILHRDKRHIARTQFADHSCDLAMLCERYQTHLLNGLPSDETARPRRKPSSLARRLAAVEGWVRALCYRGPFPPPQAAWWVRVREKLRLQFEVLRDRKRESCSAAELRQGEIILLRPGEVCPGDMRVVACTEDCTVVSTPVSLGLGLSSTYSASAEAEGGTFEASR